MKKIRAYTWPPNFDSYIELILINKAILHTTLLFSVVLCSFQQLIVEL